MLLITQSDDLLRERLGASLGEVEARFSAELLSDLACVNDLVRHVERYRGKMLRPTLLLVSAMACDGDGAINDEQRVIATVVEMVHMATLVHDDILDEADMRRRGSTINHLAGNEAAVMLGDYLISHAYHLCSSIDRPDVSRTIAFATNTVCEGELLQLANRNNWSLDEPTYFEIIRRKTASLCGTCCRLGRMLCDDAVAAKPDAVGEALYRYGEKLGVAFQIIDDLLDLTGDEETVGKTIGRDLEKGKLTLPLIRYLGQASPEEQRQTRELLKRHANPSSGPDDRAAAVADVQRRITASDSVDRARREAAGLIEQAKSDVAEHLRPSPARALLMSMADAVLTRDY